MESGRDCAECDTDGSLDKIAREIKLFGPLADAQRVKLLEIADKCPVHWTLRSEVLIPTRANDSAHTRVSSPPGFARE